jgi:hypothetical protein
MEKHRLIQLACLQFTVIVFSNAAVADDGGPYLNGRNAFVIEPGGARYEIGDSRMQVPQGSRLVSLEGGEAVVEYGDGRPTYRLRGNEILTLNKDAKSGRAKTKKPLEYGDRPTRDKASKHPPGNRQVGYAPPGHHFPDNRSPGHRPPGHRTPHCPPISP